MTMILLDPDEQRFFMRKCDEALQSAIGDAFQSLFQKLMVAAYGDDFQSPRPHGPFGDFGSDGYLTSKKHGFQCYAPEALNPTKATAKMTKDLKRAIQQWKGLTKWCYVVNTESAPSPLVQAGVQLGHDHGISVTTWTRNNVRELAYACTRAQLTQIFGPCDPYARMERLTRQTIANVLSRIELDAAELENAKMPTPGKMDRNEIGKRWRLNLRIGMTGSPQVRGFFHEADGAMGRQVQAAMTREYLQLESTNPSADQCLSGLANFLQLASTNDSQEQVAVYAILSYFFESCDILRPEEGP